MKNFIYSPILISLFWILAVMPAQGQQKTSKKISLVKLLTEQKLTVVNRAALPLKTALKYDGLQLDERTGTGLVWLNDSMFSNGTISIKLRGKDVLQRSFIGLAFHGTTDTTFDALYFRPFNFKSPDSVRRSHALQYVSYPGFEWDLLRKDFPGKYESEVQPAPDPNAWFLMRIEIAFPIIRVYVNNAARPSLVVRQLSKQGRGRIGLMTGNNSSGDFADLEIRPTK